VKPRGSFAHVIEKSVREAQGRLVWLEAHAETIVENYEKWLDDGNQGRSYDGDGRGGQELTQPERDAESSIAGGDRIVRDWAALVKEISAASKACGRAKRLGENFVVDTSDSATREASSVASLKNQPAGSGTCENCGRECSGARGKNRAGDATLEDRLKAKRCPPCYLYWYRSGRLEERPREMWNDERLMDYEIDPRPARCVAEKWSAGTEYACRLFEDHDGDHDWIKRTLVA
jgi:hypothetical protein